MTILNTPEAALQEFLLRFIKGLKTLSCPCNLLKSILFH